MNYPLSEKFNTPELMAKIMCHNSLKLQEELLMGTTFPPEAPYVIWAASRD